MASTDHQLALSRSSAHRHHPSIAPPNVAEKSKGPPAFLQKLFEMLNDPKSTDLIRWSAAGDSFFVLDHERLAREVLPRWFKHQNFSSFVRQLNMYGFHKIPHLQQGVLRSDTDTEFWNFAHPDFIRGHPELLFRIRRKKQNSQVQQQQADEAAAAAAAVAAAGLVTDGNGSSVVGVGPSGPGSTGANSSTGLASLNNSQLLDVHQIVQGIAAIKRHQVAIAAELSELKRSNEMLWQDALLAREKHQKQEDTINKIVKFLAGVFGKHAAPGPAGLGNGGGGGGAGQGPGGGGGVAHGDANSGNGSSSSVQRRSHLPGNGQQSVHGEGNRDGGTSRKRARLMIEDGRRQPQSVPPLSGSKSNTAEVTEEDEEEDVPMFDNTTSKRGLGGNVPPTTLSEYHPPSPSLSSCLDLPGTRDDTFSFSTLDLSDRDATIVGGAPTHSRQHSQTHGRRDSTEYPRIEMEVETPTSVNTPLPRFASPAESITSGGAKSLNKTSTATTPAHSSVSNLSNERALTHTPPLIYPPQDNNNNNGFHFDPRNMMTINLPYAQVQQLLTTLANQTISDPNNGGGEGFESGFLVPLDGNNGVGNRHALQQLQSSQHQPTASPPPFDLSSYLIPSPQLAGMPLANNSPVPPSSTPATAATTTTNTSKGTTTATAKTKQNGSGSGSTSKSTTPPSASKSTTPPTAATPQSNDVSTSYPQPTTSATAGGVPVPDGLIAFDGPDAATTPASNAGTAATTGVASPATSYTGDMSVGMRAPSPFVFPFAGGYQDYNGYPTGASTAITTGANSGSAPTTAAQGYAYGYNPYTGANGGWNTTGSTGGGGGGGTTSTDFNGLFSPVLSNQKVGYGSPSIPPSSPSVGMQSPQSHHAYVHYGNNNSAATSSSVGTHQSNLASLAANWRDTDDIDRDVGVLDTTIHSLIQTLGLDAGMMEGFSTAASGGANEEDAGGGGGDPVADGNGTNAYGMTAIKGSGGGRKNSQNLDFETLLSSWGSSTGAAEYEHQLHNGGAGSSGLTNASDSTSGSSSTPSTGEDPDGSTSVTSGVSGPDEVEDGVTPGNMSVISSPAIPPAVVGGRGVQSLFGGSASPIPIPPSRNHAGQKPNGVVGSPGTSAGTVLNGSPPRPINKKARTSLTASAPTSAGVPTTVEPAGTGRKRRSTVITGNVPTTSVSTTATTTSSSSTATATSVAGEVNGIVVDGLLNGVDEHTQLVGHEQPGTGPAGQGQSQGVQKRSTAKAKKRRG